MKFLVVEIDVFNVFFNEFWCEMGEFGLLGVMVDE